MLRSDTATTRLLPACITLHCLNILSRASPNALPYQPRHCRTLVEDSPDKLFIGGLPPEWAEEQVKELLAAYGGLKSFNLVMDKATGAPCSFCDSSDVLRLLFSILCPLAVFSGLRRA